MKSATESAGIGQLPARYQSYADDGDSIQVFTRVSRAAKFGPKAGGGAEVHYGLTPTKING